MVLVVQMATCQASVCTTAGQTRLASSENDKHPFLIYRASANATLHSLRLRGGKVRDGYARERLSISGPVRQDEMGNRLNP